MAPGDHFFLRRIDLPAGMGSSEVPGFVALRWEELSPFPLEQLYRGHVRSEDGTAVFAYAAYKRRFPAAHAETWPSAMFVLPDFLPALRMKFPRPTSVRVRSDAALTLLHFEANRELPVRAASRPLAPDAPPDAVEGVAQRLAGQIGGPHGAEVSFRLAGPPVHNGKSLEWTLRPEGSGKAVSISIPVADCWAMDVRDPEFVAQQRKRLGFDVVLWRIAQGAAAAIALLLAGELLLLGARAYENWLGDRVRAQTAEVTALEDKDGIANRLTDFSRSGAHPFEMFAVVGRLVPPGMVFVQATVEGGTRLQFDATTPNLGDIAVFENALRAAPQIAFVEVAKPLARPEGTTFSATIEFNGDAFAPPATTTAVTPPRPP